MAYEIGNIQIHLVTLGLKKNKLLLQRNFKKAIRFVLINKISK